MPSLFMTGASGFIGKQFLTHYAQNFDKIILPLRRQPNFDIPANADVRIVEGRSDEIANCLLDNPCRHILNAAAYGISPKARDAKDMVAVNTKIPVELAKASQTIGAEKFVQLGTMSEYVALTEKRPTVETDALIAESETYGGSKAQAFRGLETLAGQGDMQIACLRLFGVYGPGEGAHRLAVSLYDKMSAGLVAPMSAGTQVRDFIYISDVLRAMYLALTTSIEPKFQAFNIGSGVGVSVADFARALCQAAGFSDNQLDFGALPMRDTDVPYVVADIMAAKTQLGWAPQWTAEAALKDYTAHLAGRS